MRQSEALDAFEQAVIQAIERNPDHTIVIADFLREFSPRAPRSSCVARLEQMERRGLIAMSRFAGRILVHLPVEA